MSNLKPDKALIRQWNTRLKVAGFVDIEYWSSSGEPKEWLKSNSKFRSEDAALTLSPTQTEEADTVFLADRDYFIEAEHLLNKDIFISEEHRRVWELHAQGKSLRAIEKDPDLTLSHTKAKRIIDRYRRLHFNLVLGRKK